MIVTQAIITIGMQFGDEGKGQSTDYLCRQHKADIVVRYSGGSQCSHAVTLADGRSHRFSQFGSGTLANVPTYLGPQVIINPPAIVKEAEHLTALGVTDVWKRLIVHPDCLVTTVFHQALNRAKELARGPDRHSVRRHGSCGHGIGETRAYWLKYGNDAITAGDLLNKKLLRKKMELLRQRILIEMDSCSETTAMADVTSSADTTADHLFKITRFTFPWLQDHVPKYKTAVYEAAQGVLLDEWFGFHPYTTWSTVTQHHALEMLQDSDEVYTLGIARAFTARHGAGPLPTFDAKLHKLMNDPNNPSNEWQGDFRWGYLDLPLLRYAADVVRLVGELDGIALTWLDKAENTKVCTDYKVGKTVAHIACYPDPKLKRQQSAGECLSDVTKVYIDAPIRSLVSLVHQIAPVEIESYGPTSEDRKGRLPI